HTLTSLSYSHPARAALSTLSLHDALPIFKFGDHLFDGILQTRLRPLRRRVADLAYPAILQPGHDGEQGQQAQQQPHPGGQIRSPDRKSTRLNSSHLGISYAVFCLKKKNKK